MDESGTYLVWASAPIMIGIDLAIFLLIAGVFAVGVRYGEFRKGKMPRLGRILAMSGIGLIGFFYLLDLLAIVLLPNFVGADRAVEITRYLRLEANWFFTLVALLLIGAGFGAMAQQRRRFEGEMARRADQFALIEEEIVRSETRFRSLIEQTPDPVYCLEFDPGIRTDLPVDEQIRLAGDGVVVECNQAMADQFGIRSAALAGGMRFGEFQSTQHAESHVPFMRAFIDNNYRLRDYDLEYKDLAGKERSLRVNLTGVVKNGELIRIWAAEVDTLAQKQIKKALLDRQRFQEFILEMSTCLITCREDLLSETLRHCLRDTCIFLGYDRASITWVDRDNRTADALYFWNEHGGPPRIAANTDNYPWMAARLLRGDTVMIADVSALPPEAQKDSQKLREGGLTSMVAVPLAIGDQVLGAFTLGNLEGTRDWSEQELSDLRVIAGLMVNVVNRVLIRQSLDDALAELRVAKDRLEAENVYLQQEIRSSHGFDEIVGESPQLNRCLRQVAMVADTTTTVLIQGDTGTGKELIARAIHELSSRNNRPLVKVNCAALPANLIESELFGHQKGAFTGALSAKRGRFDLADEGTLFLDEIGDFPLELQGKLLRVIQEGEFERLGGTRTIKVNVRLIAATNRNLQQAVDDGEFRADLFYRINTFPIYLPRLSERVGDVPLLAQHFARKHAALLGKDVTAISASMMEKLNAYQWPGNVRELEGVIQRALISATGPILDSPELTALDSMAAGDDRPTLPGAVDLQFAERTHIESILVNANWVIGGDRGAAAMLGIPPSTLRSKMKKLGIQRPFGVN